MNRSPRRWRGVLAVLVIPWGCRGLEIGGGDGREERPQPNRILAEIQDAHGGLDRWLSHAGISLRYEAVAEGGETILSVEELTFWLDETRFVWVASKPGASPVRLDLTQNDADLASELRRLGVSGQEAPPEGPRILAAPALLRLFRYLLLPPMATAAGLWEVRSILSPPGVDLPPVVEIAPLERHSPFTACVLGTEPGTRALRDAVYSIPEAPVGQRLFRVTFESPQWEAGLLLPCSRVHRRVPTSAGDEGPADPFGLSERRRLQETRELIRERVSAVRWLSRDAMASRFPREDDVESTLQAPGAEPSPRAVELERSAQEGP